MPIFVQSEFTTLPIEQRTRVELFLCINMKYNNQPLDTPAQIAMLKGRGLIISSESFKCNAIYLLVPYWMFATHRKH